MLWITVLAGALVVTGPRVEVELLTGESLVGQLAHLSSDNLGLEIGGEPRQIAWDELLNCSLLPAASPRENPPKLWIELVDGSYLPADAFETDQDQHYSCGPQVFTLHVRD